MKKNETEKQLSDQALGAIMMALQKSLLEQSDLVPALRGMRFKESPAGLMVMNPPLVKYEYGDEEASTDDEAVVTSTE